MNEIHSKTASGLFDVPGFEAQEQLMAFPVPAEQPVDSTVDNPVARVLVDAPSALWDPVFDYEIPPKLADTVRVGCRVRVPYNSQRVEGFVVERVRATAHLHGLRRIERVMSPFEALKPEIYELCRAIAERQAAPLMDVVRCAVPSRHARAEREMMALSKPALMPFDAPQPGLWKNYCSGEDFIKALAGGACVRAGVTVAPAHDMAELLIPLVLTQLSQSQGVIIVLPTPRDVFLTAQTLSEHIPDEPIATFTGELSHEARYRSFVGAAQGRTRVIVGTRSCAFAPMVDLGLVAIVDPAHVAHREQRSPRVDSCDVLMLRSDMHGCSFVAFSRGPSVRMAALEDQQWLQKRIVPQLDISRSLRPRIVLAQDMRYEGAPWARMPDSVFKVIRSGLSKGDVLLVAPRSGYMPVVVCARCGERARCPQCAGWCDIPAPDAHARCIRCGATQKEFTCHECGFHKLRGAQIGSTRTAQEIGRAFPGTSILLARRLIDQHERENRGSGNELHCTCYESETSSDVCGGKERKFDTSTMSAAHTLHSCNVHEGDRSGKHEGDRSGKPEGISTSRNRRKHAIIVATAADILDPGIRCASAVILDIGAQLRMPTLDAEEQALRLLARIAHHVYPREHGGQVLVVGDIIHSELIYAIRTLDWSHWEKHTLTERVSLRLPPSSGWISLEGEWENVRNILSAMRAVAQRSLHNNVDGATTHSTPLDAVLAGGVHQLIDHIAVLGPTPQADGTTLTYLRFAPNNRLWCTRILRRAIHECYLRKGHTRVRITVDPRM